jgi:putative membrane protein
MLIFSPIFELLGFIDSAFKLREGYIMMKRGR